MTTKLKRFTEAYATMTVAVYEPLILRWTSAQALWMIADLTVQRAEPANLKNLVLMTGHTVFSAPSLPPSLDRYLADAGIDLDKLSQVPGQPLDVAVLSSLHKGKLDRFPGLHILGSQVYPGGLMDQGNDPAGLVSGIPIIVPGRGSMPHDLPDGKQIRTDLLQDYKDIMAEAAKKFDTIPASEVRKQLLDKASQVLVKHGYEKPADFLPVEGTIFEALSPIGVAHFYRQLYYYLNEGVGPVEQAFTIAPAETLELVYETVRRQIHEEFTEIGSEIVSETAVETKNTDEVSDKVSSIIQRDTSAAMSTNATFSASGTIGVWQASGAATLGANASLAQSNQRGNEFATRRLKETTRRASERITKTFTLRTRDVQDFTTTNLTRRIIKNETQQPISYGLRRVFNRIRVKVQNLGSYLVWQIYIRNPGAGLARSRFVHFLDSDPISAASNPPSIRPRPTGGTDTGTTSSALNWDNTRKAFYVILVVQTGSDRKVTAVSIDSITDLEGGGKEDYAPSARNDVQWGQSYNASTNTFTASIGVRPGDSRSVSVNYTYSYDAGPALVQAWEDEKKAAEEAFRKAEAEVREKALRDQFDRQKALITEKSKIRARPANDLRREERYEVINRMVSHLFGRGPTPHEPSPLEIEYFHRYFDIEAMFIYTHPSWWKPRYSPVTTGLARPPYEITADSEPAPMGSSLGWVIQLDGDPRRNEFINSPWVRVCLPIRGGRERETVAWLAEHIEGEIGYDPKQEPLKGLLADIEKIRQNQTSLGINGPDYVTVNSTVGAPSGPLKPENVYPIIDEFEVTVPTEGFVYDNLEVIIP
jgi:hypothetical protein